MAEDIYCVFGPGEGHRQEARGSVMHFKARSATTGGRFSLMERTLPPGGRMPPPHLHVDCEEAYYVLKGQITFALGAHDHLCGLVSPRKKRPIQAFTHHFPSMTAYTLSDAGDGVEHATLRLERKWYLQPMLARR